jgi:hypothetical protein
LGFSAKARQLRWLDVRSREQQRQRWWLAEIFTYATAFIFRIQVE